MIRQLACMLHKYHLHNVGLPLIYGIQRQTFGTRDSPMHVQVYTHQHAKQCHEGTVRATLIFWLGQPACGAHRPPTTNAVLNSVYWTSCSNHQLACR